MRFFILKRKETFHTKKKNTHAHFTCARVTHLLATRVLPALLSLPSRSRESVAREFLTFGVKAREKRDVSFFLFVS